MAEKCMTINMDSLDFNSLQKKMAHLVVYPKCTFTPGSRTLQFWNGVWKAVFLLYWKAASFPICSSRQHNKIKALLQCRNAVVGAKTASLHRNTDAVEYEHLKLKVYSTWFFYEYLDTDTCYVQWSIVNLHGMVIHVI